MSNIGEWYRIRNACLEDLEQIAFGFVIFDGDGKSELFLILEALNKAEAAICEFKGVIFKPQAILESLTQSWFQQDDTADGSIDAINRRIYLNGARMSKRQ